MLEYSIKQEQFSYSSYIFVKSLVFKCLFFVLSGNSHGVGHVKFMRNRAVKLGLFYMLHFLQI